MIQHIILWTYKDEISQDERTRIESDLVTLPANVPTLERVVWGHVLDGTNVGYTNCFIIDFADMDAITSYKVQPAHLTLSRSFRAACVVGKVIDVEVHNG